MSKFSVLAATTVTSTGPTDIAGPVGVSPGIAITGFPPADAQVLHTADAEAAAAQAEAHAAYAHLAAMTVTQDLTGKDLGGMVLGPGVYAFSSSAELTGELTIHGDATFIIGSSLVTATGAKVHASGHVTWLVGSSATLGTGTDFVGDIIALESVTLVTGAEVRGSIVALNGAVTLDSATVV